MQRPDRREIEAATAALAARHRAQILATARHYAATPEDAEDAYQRDVEILLRKAPTTREDELVPWLKTVVKHEAFALRRQRDHHTPVTDDGELSGRPTPAAITHDQAERYERLWQGAEALGQLKPQEGRRGLAQRLAKIESGIECAKLAPLLEALAHGDATAAQLELLRPHLNTCLDCRARLKAMRDVQPRGRQRARPE